MKTANNAFIRRRRAVVFGVTIIIPSADCSEMREYSRRSEANGDGPQPPSEDRFGNGSRLSVRCSCPTSYSMLTPPFVVPIGTNG